MGPNRATTCVALLLLLGTVMASPVMAHSPDRAGLSPQTETIVDADRLARYLRSDAGHRSVAEALQLEAAAPRGTGHGEWSGDDCLPASALVGSMDTFMTTPHPGFPDLGPTTPGLSMSWTSARCGMFTRAVGTRDIEGDKPMTPATLMSLASMTKPVVASLALILDAAGTFGQAGLDSPVANFLTDVQVEALTVGDPTDPRCPGTALLWDREGMAFEPTHYSCPDLSAVTLRQLMVSHHGMYDFLNEVLLPSGATQYEEGLFFDLYDLLGLDPAAPASSTEALDHLAAFGLKRNEAAEIGGDRRADFEVSFGNTGYQLLGIILEQETGRSLATLVYDLIVAPLGLDQITTYLSERQQPNLIAHGYDVWTGNPLIEDLGVYPTVAFNGHTLVDTRDLGLGLPTSINLAGGTASMVANPKSYAAFLDAFLNGDLLDPSGKAEFESSFVFLAHDSTPGLEVSYGLGLLRTSVRGFPGLPDADILGHPGRLPGARCENGVIRWVDSGVAPIAGAACANALIGSFPNLGDFAFDLIIGHLVAAA